MTSEEASVHIEGADPSNQYLQGCVVFLSGFENQKRVLNMRKMVMAGGGMASKAFFRRVDYDSFGYVAPNWSLLVGILQASVAIEGQVGW